MADNRDDDLVVHLPAFRVFAISRSCANCLSPRRKLDCRLLSCVHGKYPGAKIINGDVALLYCPLGQYAPCGFAVSEGVVETFWADSALRRGRQGRLQYNPGSFSQ